MKKKMIGLLAVGMLVMSGCSIGASTEKQLSDTLSKMNDSESGYRSNQSKLTDLEKDEQTTFTETMDLTKEDIDKLRGKVDELEKLIDERLNHLGEEESSMKEAKGFIEELEPIAEKASDSEKDQIMKLKNAVQNRYDLHGKFVEEYKKLSSIQKEFYSMLSDEKIELTDLKQKVEEVNGQNSNVQTAINEFNEATIEVNSLKDALFSSLEKKE
ncbi:hypothetical protein SLU01_22850 [Sporosarcina luteola]|uniref:Cell-wall binding lipoprotein n=1 Tax=Sporosarcina luteola TaxID=582850 RepID=A0A511Z9A0_9BACL|nr:YkyA family protein [Sporosarcina luteola]GEN83973.1 hypothetical protein SLU01_22850 [Sporosarcina luteola]